MPTIDQLNAQFSAGGHVSFEAGQGGLTRAVLQSKKGVAHVYLHGAHVTNYTPAGGAPVLFMSAASQFQSGKPIRGGVPICFPWFGPRQNDPLVASGSASPMHGFARLMEWEVESASAMGENVTLVLVLKANDETRKLWAHEFIARYTITLGDDLALELSIVNSDEVLLEFEEALHTYFAVADVRKTRVEGLSGRTYIDKTDRLARKVQEGDVTIAAETDRVYLDTQIALTIYDPGNGRKIVNSKQSSDATVVWNPWIAKAKAMADFGDEEWPGMICVETCNVGESKAKAPAAGLHHMQAVISVTS